MVGMEPGNCIFIQLEVPLQIQLGASKFNLRREKDTLNPVLREGPRTNSTLHLLPGKGELDFDHCSQKPAGSTLNEWSPVCQNLLGLKYGEHI